MALFTHSDCNSKPSASVPVSSNDAQIIIFIQSQLNHLNSEQQTPSLWASIVEQCSKWHFHSAQLNHLHSALNRKHPVSVPASPNNAQNGIFTQPKLRWLSMLTYRHSCSLPTCIEREEGESMRLAYCYQFCYCNRYHHCYLYCYCPCCCYFYWVLLTGLIEKRRSEALQCYNIVIGFSIAIVMFLLL